VLEAVLCRPMRWPPSAPQPMQYFPRVLTLIRASMLTRKHCTHWAVVGFLLTYQLTSSSTSVYEDATFQFDFEQNAVALTAESRGRLGAAVDLARSWCGFQVAFVTGHADPSEGKSPHSLLELSKKRSAYVQQLLLQLGVPASRIFGEGKGATQSDAVQLRDGPAADRSAWAGRVDVYMRAEGRGGPDRYRDGKDGCRNGWASP